MVVSYPPVGGLSGHHSVVFGPYSRYLWKFGGSKLTWLRQKASSLRAPPRSCDMLCFPSLFSSKGPHCWKGSALKPYMELPPHTVPLGMEKRELYPLLSKMMNIKSKRLQVVMCLEMVVSYPPVGGLSGHHSVVFGPYSRYLWKAPLLERLGFKTIHGASTSYGSFRDGESNEEEGDDKEEEGGDAGDDDEGDEEKGDEGDDDDADE
ncbi:unnamed protein product [Ilex paraguariensis]|uniref:Uncharacterized protein n=1 Tax=Ilex paraguariensis TaxID=185542 RepID=A0ABC8TKZ7_9AQUA